MKKLILDYSTWRCGNSGSNMLGKGDTALLNSEGYMCCLGQFSLQLNKDLTPEDIQNKAVPEEVMDKEIPLLSEYWEKSDKWTHDTKLAGTAININDNEHTTPSQKIEALRNIFNAEGYEIEVINMPNDIQQAHLDGLDGVR